ncbi:MAG: hypothetical protein JNK25_13910 [Phycisphaerae bacterium]|nr:hypothetical protein [Phycisphaerae bacterium]
MIRVVCISCVVFIASAATAQVPASPPPSEPTLDELLGLPKKPAETKPAQPGTETPKPTETPQEVTPIPVDPAKAELDRKLGNEEQKDDFALAVELMGQTARRLNESRDSGIDTQRLQKQTLDKLDKLIEQARKQKSKSKSKSKSQNSDPQNQNQSQPQSSQAQQSGADQQQQAGANASGGNVPLNSSGRLNPPPGAGAAWGQLPDRLREALLQGSGDTMSVTWGQATRDYFKRLAEQPTKPGGQ